MNDLFTLSGKTALITGSSRGLGRALASGLSEAGARVIVNGIDRERVGTALAELRAEGFEAFSAAFDVNDEPAVVAAFEKLDRDGIAVDILINNAGIQFRKPMLELATADWRRVIETNLTACFVVGREAARRMAERGKGKIINIASLTSELARATVAPCTAAKGGIKMLTKSMAVEWGALGIQANAIGPGYMLTEMNAELTASPEFDAWVKGRTPMRRWGRPDELVGTAVYLASSASNYVNGQVIYVDGGMVSAL